MNKKKWMKKSSAILLAICMVAGALQYVPHISKAATTSVNEQLQAAGYTRLTPESFGLDGTYTSVGMTRGVARSKSLDHSYLDLDVTFNQVTNGNTHLRFAMGAGDGGINIIGYKNDGSLRFRDANTGTNENSLNYLMSLETTFNLKLAIDYGTTSDSWTNVTYSVWVNNSLVIDKGTMPVKNVGSNLAIAIGTKGDSITLASPSEEEPDLPSTLHTQLQEAGYTRVTPSTFGLDGTYTSLSRGVALNKSLDKHYLDMNVSFDKVTNGNTCIRFGGDGDTGISIIGYTNSNYIAFRDPSDNSDESQIQVSQMKDVTALTDTFNLKIAIKYGTITGTQTIVTYSVWIDDVLLLENKTIDVAKIGQNMGIHIGTKGDSITVSTPNLTLEELGYRKVTLADDFGLKNGSYYPNVVSSDHYIGTYNRSLNNRYLDVDLSFSVNSGNTCIRYASENGWKGISIHGYSGGLQLTEASYGENKQFTYAQMGLDASKGLTETFNLKLITKLGEPYTHASRGRVCDVTCVVFINDKEIGTHTFTAVPGTGSKAAIYAHNGVVNLGSITEKTLTPASYDVAEGGYLVTGTIVKVWKDGVLQTNVASGSVLSDVGNYIIERFDNTVKSTQSIILYKLGDVDCNGSFSASSDLVALQTLLNGKANEYKVLTAADFAADLDNDNNVGTKDLKLMQAISNGTKSLEDVKKIYHVPAVSYDYLGGDEVMPIFGFYGPYETESINFITDEVFQLIKDSGINTMVYTSRVINPASNNISVLKAMELAQKYGIGYYADDIRLNTEIMWSGGQEHDNTGAAPLSNEALANYLTAYSHYENYLGIHVLDEPCPNEEPDDWIKTIENVDGVSALLNGFANHHGHINANPNYYNSDFIDFEIASNYESYLTDIVKDCDVPMLCYDYYPFEHYNRPISKYFDQIVSTRKVAEANNIPFWAYVQAGGNHNAGATVSEKQPSSAQTYWNANTLLAFGAKGIGWFTALQPEMMVPGEGATDRYDRLGVVGQDGTKTDYYDEVQKMNKQIAAVDEVLMKAKSTGVMAVHDAATDVGGSIELLTSTDMLESIATSRYSGALVGCFDYRDTEAFYVVNYDVENSQTVSLFFKDNYDYRMVKDGEASFHTGEFVTMSIPAGEAVLIVLEDRMVEVSDISEYRNATDGLNIVPDAEPGYVFAGWYDASSNPISSSMTSGKAYAKFVDENVMAVKAQITANTTASSKKADIRFVSTVDSLDYEEVGFVITPQGGTAGIKSSTKVYEQLYYAGQGSTTVDNSYKPTVLSPQSKYFYAYSYWDILNEHFSYTFIVTPYWKTLDGTTVYGQAVVKSVSMGIGE